MAPWTVACQAPQPMEFSRQEYWSGVPFPTPGELPNSGTEPASPVAPAFAREFFTTELPGKPLMLCVSLKIHLSFLNSLNHASAVSRFLQSLSFTPFLVFSAPWTLVSNGHSLSGHHLQGAGASGHVRPRP